MKISDWCEGKWPEIIRSILGPEWIDTGKHNKCPRSGEGEDRYRFSNVNDRGNYFCSCSEGDKDGFELIQCVKGWDFTRTCQAIEAVIGKCPPDDEPPPKKKSTVERLQGKIRDNIKKSGYLQKRGLEIAPGLKWHNALPYYNEKGERVGSMPAMLAPIQRDGKVLTYHATWILDGGDDKIRKILASDTSLRGAAVQLYPINGDVLGVAEGVETAIAAKMMFKIPVWSLISTALMKSWNPPSKIKKVVIFGDADKNYAGQAAAFNLAHRLKKMNQVEVVIKFPPEKGMDFNDVLLAESV